MKHGDRKQPADLPKFLRRARGAAPVPPPAEPEPDLTPYEMPVDLCYQEVFYIRGVVPRNLQGRWHSYEVKDPPNSGQSHAFVLGKPDDRRRTIFCPFSLTAHQVRASCGELARAEPEEMTVHRVTWLVELMTKRWNEFQRFGYQRDYDVAAAVFKKLGAEVPAQMMTGGGEDTRERGGKPAAKALLKVVNPDSKRGRFLRWFLEDGGGPRSVRECMAEFDITRSNALSYLYMLNKDHGLGYSLVGDNAEVHLPDGCDDPFEDDDSWLD